MPQQFVFNAPNYFDREIDATVQEVPPTGIPATVIGPSLKGPAFTPRLLGSYSDFEARFGRIDPKFSAGYAVAEFLKPQTAAVFIRTLGAGANSTTTDFDNTRTKGVVVNAGFQVSGSVVNSGTDNRHKGSVQFLAAKHAVSTTESFAYPLFTDNDSYTLASNFVYLMRAMVFLADDTRLMVMNTNETYSNVMDDLATIDSGSSSPTFRKFKLVLSSAAGTSFGSDDGVSGLKIYTASFNPSDDDYFAKILNTDPEKLGEYKHVLYGNFAVDAELAAVASGSSQENSIVVFSGSANTSTASGDTTLSFRSMYGRFDTRYTVAKTPVFISQPFGTTEFDLFYFEGLDDGMYPNNKYKVSIQNLKASSDPNYDYGTFTVVVRDFNDTDFQPIVLEQFSNVSLDPSSQNYIARVIGDKKTSYLFDTENEGDRKLKISGNYANRSRLIRVIMNANVDSALSNPKCLPFGFRGLSALKTNDLLNDTAPTVATSRLGASGSVIGRLSGSIVPPLPFRFKVTRGEITSSANFTGFPGPQEVVDTRLYWGVKFERNTNLLNPNVSELPNPCIDAYTKFIGISKLDALVTGSQTDGFNENKFTLARVALSAQTLSSVTASSALHIREAAYIRNGEPDGTNYYITDGAYGNRVTLATLIGLGTSIDFNKFTEYAKFTTIMYGGYDGINILDRNSVRFWDKATSTELSGCASSTYISPGALVNWSGTGLNNNAVRSFRTAIDLATDPISINSNLLVVPGQREPLITDYATEKNQDYGLGFYLMDIPAYENDGDRIFDGDNDAIVDIRETASNFDVRAVSNNACAAYMPNSIIDDNVNNRRVVVPASVVVLAAYGNTDKIAFPWFAPAGFDRTSFSIVKNTKPRIKQPEREVLFNVRVNPIVSFPQQGFVLFSQQTLQQEKTLLVNINVKRMILEAKRGVIQIGRKILWDNITSKTYENFSKEVNNLLSSIQQMQGLEKFEIICDDRNNNANDRNNNKINGLIYLYPTTPFEYAQLDFVVTPSGVEFPGL